MTLGEVMALRVELQNVRNTLAGIRDMRQQIQSFGDQVNRTATRTIDVNKRAAGSFGTLGEKIAASTAAIYTMRKAWDAAMAAVNAAQQKQGFELNLRANVGETAGQAISRQTTDLADKYGMPIQDTRSGVARLAAAGVEPEKITKTLRAFAAYGTLMGATQEQMKRALYEYTEMASTGKVYGQELRVMAMDMMPLTKLMRDAGMGDRLKDPSNPLKFTEINDVLLKFGETANASEMLTFQENKATSALQRVENAFINKIAVPIGQTLGPAINALGAVVLFAVDALGMIPDPVKATITAIIAAWGVWAGWTAARRAWLALENLANMKLTTSTTAASVALDGLTVSAAAASLSGGKGGIVDDALGAIKGKRGLFGPEDYQYMRKGEGYLAKKGLQEGEIGLEAMGARQAASRLGGGLAETAVGGAEAAGSGGILSNIVGALTTGTSGTVVAATGVLAIGAELATGMVTLLDKISGVKDGEGFAARMQGVRPENNAKAEMDLQNELRAMQEWRRQKRYWEEINHIGKKYGTQEVADEDYERYTHNKKPNYARPVARGDSDRMVQNMTERGLAGAK